MRIVSNEEDLQEMSNPVFLKKKREGQVTSIYRLPNLPRDQQLEVPVFEIIRDLCHAKSCVRGSLIRASAARTYLSRTKRKRVLEQIQIHPAHAYSIIRAFTRHSYIL